MTGQDSAPAMPARAMKGGPPCAGAGLPAGPQGGGDVAGKTAEARNNPTNSTPSHPAASAAVGAQVVPGLDPGGAAAMPISGPRTSGVMRGPEVPDDEPLGSEDASTAQDVTAGETAFLHLCMGCNDDLPPGSIASRKWCDECIRKRKNKRKVERDREIRTQLGVSARQYKRLHAQPVERTTIGKGRCRLCAGLSERRPVVGTCGGCGLPWAPERQVRVEDFTSSGSGALGRACESRVR